MFAAVAGLAQAHRVQRRGHDDRPRSSAAKL